MTRTQIVKALKLKHQQSMVKIVDINNSNKIRIQQQLMEIIQANMKMLVILTMLRRLHMTKKRLSITIINSSRITLQSF